MIIKEIYDLDEIKKVLYHPDIVGKIGREFLPEEDFNPKGDIQWIAGYIHNEIIGLMVYNLYNKKVYCHIQMMPEYRKRYTIKFMRMALSIGKAKNASIYAEISKDRPEIITLAKAFNFKVIARESENTFLLRLDYANFRTVRVSG